MPSTSKLLTQAQYQALITGIPKYCANTVFSVAGQSFTATQAVTLVQSLLNVSAATAAAKSAAKEAVATEQATIGQNALLVRGIRESIGLTYSNSPTTLTAFDIQPRKSPKPLSTEARAAATAKAKATRQARGTASKKQKATISGDVTGVTITPVTRPTGSASATSTSSVAEAGQPAVGTPVSATSTSSTPATSVSSVAGAGQPAVGAAAGAGASGSITHA
jgi:hypothetical protein